MNYKNLIMVVLALALLAGVAQAAQYDFQDSGIGDWTYSTGSGSGTVTVAAEPSLDTYALYFKEYGTSHWIIATPNLHQQIYYIAFTVGPDTRLYSYDDVIVRLYDANGDPLVSSPNFKTSLGESTKRVEVFQSGAQWVVYVDGVYTTLNWETGGTPYNFGISMEAGNGLNPFTYIYVDDIVVGGRQPDILGTAGDSYFYILKDFDDPTNNGLYDADGIVYTDAFHTTYGVNTQVDRVDEIRIETYHIGTGYTVNTTTIDTHEHPAGVIEYDLDDLFFDDEDAPFGLYIQRMYDTADNDILDTVTLVYLSSMADCDFDTGIYYYGNTATVTWDIATNGTWDTGTYTYSGQIIDQYGSLIDEWNINTATGSHNDQITTDDYDDGTIYALLWAEEKATGDDFLIAYDIAEVDEAIVVSGTTYNVESGAALGTVDVTYTQGETAYEDTSSAGGAYSVEDLAVNTLTAINATKTNYTHTDWNWTPLASQQYTIDLYLMPIAPAFSVTAVNGIVYDTIYHQPVSGATVTIENLTWNDTTVSSASGYYIFNNLTNTTYTVSAAGITGLFAASDEYEVTPLADNVTQQNVEMDGIYTLTVECRERSSEALISDSVLLELSTGATTTTTAGVGTFSNLPYGLYDISASTDEMSGTSEGILVDENETATVYLSSDTGGGAGISYPPHNVQFVVKTVWGQPIEDVEVTATYIESTGPIEWLFDWIGISEDVDVENTEMSGTTDALGCIDFMMVESVKYRVTFEKVGIIDQEMEVYPKDDQYIVLVNDLPDWWEAGYDEQEVVTIDVTGTEINATYASITIQYNDTLSDTTGGTVWLNQTNKTAIGLDQDNLDSYNVAATNFTATFYVTSYHGESYFVNVDTEHDTFGFINRTFTVMFEEEPVSTGLPESWNIYIAAFLILFTGCFFGATTSPTNGALIVCFEGWVFWGIGWLDDLGAGAVLCLTFATFISVLSIIMIRSRKERFV